MPALPTAYSSRTQVSQLIKTKISSNFSFVLSYTNLHILFDTLHIIVYTNKEVTLTPRDKAIERLQNNGYYKKRSGKKQDIYYNDQTKCIIPLKRHDFDDNDLMYITKEIKQYKGLCK